MGKIRKFPQYFLIFLYVLFFSLNFSLFFSSIWSSGWADRPPGKALATPCKIESKHVLLQLLLSESCCVVLIYLSSKPIFKLSPVVNTVILLNQTKEISRDFTRFAIISKPKIQITQNKNPVESNYIAYHILANFYKTDIQLSQKKNSSFNDALLLTHAV